MQTGHAKVVKKLKEYLDEEAKDKGRSTNPSGCDAVGVEVLVPQQEDFSNCGLFILHYVEKLLKDDGAIRHFIHVRLSHGSLFLASLLSADLAPFPLRRRPRAT